MDVGPGIQLSPGDAIPYPCFTWRRRGIPTCRKCRSRTASTVSARWIERVLAVFAKTGRLVHALVEHGDDADSAIGQDPPIDIVMRMACVEALDAELCRQRAPDDFPRGDAPEAGKKVSDIGLGLVLAPGVARIGEYLVEPLSGGGGKRMGRRKRFAISFPSC